MIPEKRIIKRRLFHALFENTTVTRSDEESFRGVRYLHYALFSCGLISFYMLPVWAGVFSEDYGLAGSQVGALLAADLGSGTVASFLARYWIHRAAWRPILWLSILLTAVSNAFCAFTDDYHALLLTRFLAGFSAATMMAFAYAAFSNVESPEKEFSLALAAQVALGTVLMLLSSRLLLSVGPEAVFLLPAAASLLPLLFCWYFPAKNPVPEQPNSVLQVMPSRSVMLALLAVILFMTALTAIWVFVESLGSDQGYDYLAIGLVIAGGYVFSFAGAIAPNWLIDVIAPSQMVKMGYGALLIALIMLGVPVVVWLFAFAICLYNFFYSFVMPLQSAWISRSDTTGRNAVLVPVAQGAGAAMGPIAAGLAIEYLGVYAVVPMSLAFLAMSYLCVLAAGAELRDLDSV